MVTKEELKLLSLVRELKKTRGKKSKRRQGDFLGRSVTPLFTRQPQPISPQQFQPQGQQTIEQRIQQKISQRNQKKPFPFSSNVNKSIESPFAQTSREFDNFAIDEIAGMEITRRDGITGELREREFLSNFTKREGLGLLN